MDMVLMPWFCIGRSLFAALVSLVQISRLTVTERWLRGALQAHELRNTRTEDVQVQQTYPRCATEWAGLGKCQCQVRSDGALPNAALAGRNDDDAVHALDARLFGRAAATGQLWGGVRLTSRDTLLSAPC